MLSETFQGAQCSELVKSTLPSIWLIFYAKTEIFLVTQEQKLRAGDHWALLEHSPVVSDK